MNTRPEVAMYVESWGRQTIRGTVYGGGSAEEDVFCATSATIVALRTNVALWIDVVLSRKETIYAERKKIGVSATLVQAGGGLTSLGGHVVRVASEGDDADEDKADERGDLKEDPEGRPD
jgi:hypothetical protein